MVGKNGTSFQRIYVTSKLLLLLVVASTHLMPALFAYSVLPKL
uniref:Uncharacterized protein n=1 Tax=Arundo donax TaxID=35708 RepID=A0A0A9I2C8_ARUDO